MMQYANQVTSYCLARIAAFQAGSGAQINFPGGTLVVGDGNGAVPALSALVTANGVTHEVWRGATVSSVSIDANNPQQIDVQCAIPAVIGGVEVGPFVMREFALLDETGTCCVVGTANIEKLTSAQGAISDIVFTVAIVVSAIAAVVVSPPSTGFASMVQVEAAINAHQPTAVAPLTQTDTSDAQGWLVRVFGLRAATQILTGYGRAATDAEFAAGVPAATGFQWPWPTLVQIHSALASVAVGAAEGVKLVTGALHLAFEQLTSNTALASGDILARYRLASTTHASMTLGDLAAWLRAQNKPLVPVARWETAGVYTFTAPADGWCSIETVGAGGGGGGGSNSGVGLQDSTSGGGGGSGGFARKAVYLTGGQQVTVTVGAAGIGGTTTSTANSELGGGASAFGAFLSASGGRNGHSVTGNRAGGAPGVGAGGDINRPGCFGGEGADQYGQGSGFGAPSACGGGGRASKTLNADSSGQAPGSGGGGSWGSSIAGGGGADGSVIVYA